MIGVGSEHTIRPSEVNNLVNHRLQTLFRSGDTENLETYTPYHRSDLYQAQLEVNINKDSIMQYKSYRFNYIFIMTNVEYRYFYKCIRLKIQKKIIDVGKTTWGNYLLHKLMSSQSG